LGCGGVSPHLTLFGVYVLARMATAIIPPSKSHMLKKLLR
jgi:hypothetical protein